MTVVCPPSRYPSQAPWWWWSSLACRALSSLPPEVNKVNRVIFIEGEETGLMTARGWEEECSYFIPREDRALALPGADHMSPTFQARQTSHRDWKAESRNSLHRARTSAPSHHQACSLYSIFYSVIVRFCVQLKPRIPYSCELLRRERNSVLHGWRTPRIIQSGSIKFLNLLLPGRPAGYAGYLLAGRNQNKFSSQSNFPQIFLLAKDEMLGNLDRKGELIRAIFLNVYKRQMIKINPNLFNDIFSTVRPHRYSGHGPFTLATRDGMISDMKHPALALIREMKGAIQISDLTKIKSEENSWLLA